MAQEDELTLILVGAVLGLIVGYGQLVWDRRSRAEAAAEAAAAAAAEAEVVDVPTGNGKDTDESG